MTIREFLQQNTAQLRDGGGSETARLDCLVLLEDVLGKDRSILLAHDDQTIPDNLLSVLNTFITQRGSNIPLAYIRGRASFFGRIFEVTEATLVPRPESESIIELLLEIASPTESLRIRDIGTGSGILGITAALSLPYAKVDASDISPEALVVARRNAARLDAPVRFLEADLLSDSTSYDIILANLPYVPTNYPINAAATHEPTLALFAGEDGMDLYHRLWSHIHAESSKPVYVITEALESQHTLTTELAKTAGYTLVSTRGLAQCYSVAS